jgi:predicted RNase H-like HicB family nuclease
MSTEYTVVIEKDEDGYFVGSVPALPGCHTQGVSIDQLLERMQEAIALWLEIEGEDASSPLELVGVQRISV